MKDKFKVGDLVRMRSGGPLMVVKTITTSSTGAVFVGCVPLEEAEKPPQPVEERLLVSIN